jgi:hypothetical protein
MVLKFAFWPGQNGEPVCLDNLTLTSMDALKAEIASKRKAFENAPQRPNKYMRRGDIEKMKEEEERKAREEAAKKAEDEALLKVRSINPPPPPLQVYYKGY